MSNQSYSSFDIKENTLSQTHTLVHKTTNIQCAQEITYCMTVTYLKSQNITHTHKKKKKKAKKVEKRTVSVSNLFCRNAAC